MSTIVPDVSGLGVAVDTARLHMFLDAYSRSVGKGEGKVDVPYAELEGHLLAETLAAGFYNEPLEPQLPEGLQERYPELAGLSPGATRRWLWERYCALGCAERAELVKELTGSPHVTMSDMESLPSVFGHGISLDRHTLPNPDPDALVAGLQAPVLVRTGWYDWFVHDALATWVLLRRSATEPVRSGSRLLIAPAAHNMPGYHEGMAEHPELHHAYGVPTSVEFLQHWYSTVREGRVEQWPRVVYYLMGANEWRAAEDWPVPGAREVALFLQPGGALSTQQPPPSEPDHFTYDPQDPTPTVGGSIVSFVYPPGSVDVSAVQQRPDVLTYTTGVLERDLDVVGPVRLLLHASSSAVDTDFNARLSDVFPDGRAIQLQSGMLRARFRDLDGEPALLEPGRVYVFEIDMWATANRFRAGHRLRLDLSSADFPKYDRNTNLGGAPGAPVLAHQTIHHDPDHPSQLRLCVLDGPDDLLSEE
jgi:putative CocE/NonD family hydrolase